MRINMLVFLPFSKALQAWHVCILEERMLKEKAADEMHHFLLMKRCLSGWQKVCFIKIEFQLELVLQLTDYLVYCILLITH